jgi:hypothetical protein
MKGQSLRHRLLPYLNMSLPPIMVQDTPSRPVANVEKDDSVAWVDHPQNPRNWTARKKWTTAWVVSYLILL